MDATAIIPARGGSKGVPGKNLREVGGMPLIVRAIKTCQSAGIERVIVTTDSEEIAVLSMKHGAVIRWRPAWLATDEALVWPAIQDVVKHCGVTGPIAFVQCTAPLTTAGDIRRCLEKLADCDVAIACHESNLFLLDGNGKPVNVTFPIPRRQDFQRQYAISGSVWAFNAAHTLKTDMYAGNIGIATSENPIRLDIDSMDDLLLANRLISYCEDGYPQ